MIGQMNRDFKWEGSDAAQNLMTSLKIAYSCLKQWLRENCRCSGELNLLLRSSGTPLTHFLMQRRIHG